MKKMLFVALTTIFSYSAVLKGSFLSYLASQRHSPLGAAVYNIVKETGNSRSSTPDWREWDGSWGNEGPFPTRSLELESTRQSEQERLTFSDVRGMGDAKFEFTEVIDFLKRPEKYERLGATLPGGILLEGPPGVGKTLLAKAAAGEAGCAFFSASGSEFHIKWVGEGRAKVAELFERARRAAPAIIFIDEIDSLGSVDRFQNDGDAASNEFRATINELLHQMDGFQKNNRVIVIGATNAAATLDKALMRPGRFTRIIQVPLPTREEREDILNYYIEKMATNVMNHGHAYPFSISVSSKEVATLTLGFSPAELKNLVNEASILASRYSSNCITKEHFLEAFDRVTLGIKTQLTQTKAQLQRTAYHEAGHALVLALTGQPVSRITIVSRGKSLGGTIKSDRGDVNSYTEVELKNMIQALQAGYVAEKIMFQTPSLGACDDFSKAKAIAREMVNNGMGTAFQGIGRVGESEIIKYEFDKEQVSLLNECLVKTEALLKRHKHDLKRLATKIFIEETLNEEQIYATLNMPKPTT